MKKLTVLDRRDGNQYTKVILLTNCFQIQKVPYYCPAKWQINTLNDPTGQIPVKCSGNHDHASGIGRSTTMNDPNDKQLKGTGCCSTEVCFRQWSNHNIDLLGLLDLSCSYCITNQFGQLLSMYFSKSWCWTFWSHQNLKKAHHHKDEWWSHHKNYRRFTEYNPI